MPRKRVVDPARPGIRTSEGIYTAAFGLAVTVFGGLTALGVVKPDSPAAANEAKWEALAAGIIVAGYNLSRAITKHGVATSQRPQGDE